jgi:hypothetical protein
MNLFSKLLLSVVILLSVPGCISNIFKEPKPTFSEEVILPQLNSDFNKLSGHVYPAWKHKDTGNVISIISDCTAGSFSLKSIHGLMSDSLDTVKVIEEKSTTVNNRKSVSKTVRGEIEGKAIEIRSYSLQHGTCTYVTSLAGNPEKINLNQEHFKNFLQQIDFKK